MTILDGTLTDQRRAVLPATGVGNLSPGQAAQLLAGLAGLGALAKIIETGELVRRIAALEAKKP